MSEAEELTVLTLEKKANFVETPYIQGVAGRALDYIGAGYPIHFSGPAGTGKTALAMHVAAQLGRQVILIHGDDEFGSSDLIGGQTGFRSTKVVDNYIHSVLKQEETVSKQWGDNRLTTACKYGFTLIYDEFTRSRPEANNVLLSILEERLLELPDARSGDGYLQVHPQFSAIFTSNPEEYAGVHKTQDALMDRLITITRPKWPSRRPSPVCHGDSPNRLWISCVNFADSASITVVRRYAPASCLGVLWPSAAALFRPVTHLSGNYAMTC